MNVSTVCTYLLISMTTELSTEKKNQIAAVTVLEQQAIHFGYRTEGKMNDLLVELHGEVEAIEEIMDGSLQRIDRILTGTVKTTDLEPKYETKEGESLKHCLPFGFAAVSELFLSVHRRFIYAIDS
jgi:hypothetical protein